MSSQTTTQAVPVGPVKTVDLKQEALAPQEYSHGYNMTTTIMDMIYGGSIEIGYKTRGHKCVSKLDEEIADSYDADLLYGEILPEGLDVLLDANHADIANATEVCDLGMGTGKNVIRLFITHLNLKSIIGVELSEERYKTAVVAAINLVKLFNGRLTLEYNDYCVKVKDWNNRTLTLRCGDLFEEEGAKTADVIIMNTNLPITLKRELYDLVKTLKEGCRITTYVDFLKYFAFRKNIVTQMDGNIFEGDRFLTSWSSVKGHHFFIWTRDAHEVETQPAIAKTPEPVYDISGYYESDDEENAVVLNKKPLFDRVMDGVMDFLTYLKHLKSLVPKNPALPTPASAPGPPSISAPAPAPEIVVLKPELNPPSHVDLPVAMPIALGTVMPNAA